MPKLRSASPLFLTAAMTAGLVALFFTTRHWRAAWLADRWYSQLATVDDEQAAVLLRQIAGLGDRGIPALVRALADDRSDVARQAQYVLGQQMDAWELLEEPGRGSKLAILADSLAAEMPRFGPVPRRVAAGMAHRMLLLPSDAQTASRQRLVVACEQVLRAVGQEPAPLRSSQAQSPGGDPTRTHDDPSPDDLTMIPGGNLPVEPVDLPQRLTADTSTRIDRRGGEPRSPREPAVLPTDVPLTGQTTETEGLAPAPGARPVGPSRSFDDAGNRVGSGPLESRPEGSSSNAKSDAPLLEHNAASSGQAAGDAGIAADFAQWSSWIAPMRDLHSADGVTAARAEATLRQRGFGDVELEVARRATHADVAVRRDLARALPKLSQVDARPWMELLCLDADVEVRAAAMGLLATTGDPAALDRLRRLVRGESDPQVQARLERVIGVQRR